MPLHITFSGNPHVAGGYVGVGRTMVASIKASVRKEGTSVMVLSGARIEARVVGLQEYLHIETTTETCSLYVESGYAQMGAYMHNRPGASDPAVVQMGPVGTSGHLFGKLTVGGTETVLPDAAEGSGKFQPGGFSPKALFAAPRLNETVPSEDPYEATDGSGQAGEFPISSLLERKKKIVIEVKPSLYSGKMRLFVQSLFGAPLSIFYAQCMDVYESLSQPKLLKKDGVILGFSSGIFTAGDGTYWLLSMSSLVRVYRIRLTPCGKALSQWLIENPQGGRALQSEFEAFIFAGATIDKSFSFTLSDIPAISPMAYEWKFKWDGSQAACVSIRGITDTNNKISLESSRQTVTISRDSTMTFGGSLSSLTDIEKERMRWSISSSDVVTTPEYVFDVGTTFIWVPLWLYRKQTRVSGIEQSRFKAISATHTVELYGWYDDSDKFIVVTHEGYAIPARPAVIPMTEDILYAGMWYDGLMASGSNSDLSTGKTTFKIDSRDLAAGDQECARTTSSALVCAAVPGPPIGTIWADPFYGTGYSSPFYVDGQRWNILYTYNDEFGLRYVYESGESVFSEAHSDSVSLHNASVALVIPFYDCEAAYGFRKLSVEEAAASISRSFSFYGLRQVMVNVHSDNVAPYDTPSWYQITQNYLVQMTPLAGGITTAYEPYTPKSTTEEVFFADKNGAIKSAKADNFISVLDPNITNTDMGDNQCYTFTSAVANYVTGTNIEPSDPAFASGGTFIGWF